MKKHPTEQILIAHLDGELPKAAVKRVARHLLACDRCARTVADIRTTERLVGEAFRLLDDAAPARWGGQPAITGAASSPKAPRGTSPPRSIAAEGEQSLPSIRSGGPSGILNNQVATRGSWRWAAGLAISVVAAAASAAVFGVPELPWSPSPVVQPSTPTSPDRVEGAPTAVIVRPVGGRMEVAIADAGRGSWLHVSFEGRSDVHVAVAGTDWPDFLAREGRVTVNLNGADAVITITLPHDLGAAEIRANTRLLVDVRDGRVDPPEVLVEGVPLAPDVRPGEAAGKP